MPWRHRKILERDRLIIALQVAQVVLALVQVLLMLLQPLLG